MGADKLKLEERYVVLGPSGSGKTTLARALSAMGGIPHIELDSLFWGSDWTPRPAASFRGTTQAAVAASAWVVDGNYAQVRDIVWSRATVAVWLNFPLWLLLWRLFWRTARRLSRREALWNGNCESIRRTFSRESIFVWVLRTYEPRRREFSRLRDSQEYPDLIWIECRRPKDVHLFLDAAARSAVQAQFTR